MSNYDMPPPAPSTKPPSLPLPPLPLFLIQDAELFTDKSNNKSNNKSKSKSKINNNSDCISKYNNCIKTYNKIIKEIGSKKEKNRTVYEEKKYNHAKMMISAKMCEQYFLRDCYNGNELIIKYKNYLNNINKTEDALIKIEDEINNNITPALNLTKRLRDFNCSTVEGNIDQACADKRYTKYINKYENMIDNLKKKHLKTSLTLSNYKTLIDSTFNLIKTSSNSENKSRSKSKSKSKSKSNRKSKSKVNSKSKSKSTRKSKQSRNTKSKQRSKTLKKTKSKKKLSY